jgi:predicted alpha/beta superfamily hydrolase
MRKTLSLLLLLSVCALQAQRALVISSLPANTPPGDDISLASSANGWTPGDADWIFAQAGGQWILTIPDIAPNVFQGKITRGSWATVEGNASGGFLPDRSFNFNSADTLYIEVLSWEGAAPPPTDLPPNVVVLDEAFFMPELNRSRRVRLFLPGTYDELGNDDHYPVLYMHDGQNLFSAQESFAGEWEVDEAMLAFEAGGYSGAIVVAIDHGGAFRIDEYTPYANPQYGGGGGEAYTDFIVNTLKPFVDANFRTMPGREHSGIMGSSLGGLISFYAAMAHQDVFSKVGVFSPSFWFNDTIYSFADSQGKQQAMKFLFLAGGQEGANLQNQVQEMVDILEGDGFGEDELRFDFVPTGQHSEWFWAQHYPDAFEWLYMEEATVSVTNFAEKARPSIYPNPTQGAFELILPEGMQVYGMVLSDQTGRRLHEWTFNLHRPDISALPAGLYLLHIQAEYGTFVEKLLKE